MDISIILYSTIAFNLAVVGLVMFLVRRAKMYQRIRQEKLLEQAKENYNLHELVKLKDQLIEGYRELND